MAIFAKPGAVKNNRFFSKPTLHFLPSHGKMG